MKEQPANSKPPGRWFQTSVTIAMVAAGLVAMSLNMADPDLWGHVQYGRDVLRDGWFHNTTTYSYTAEGYRWINHENFSELFYAIGADTIGPVGLLVVKLLASLLVLGLILRTSLKKQAGFVAAGVIVLLVATNLANHWHLRPQLLSYTFFALLVALLQYSFAGWEGTWRLPVLTGIFGRKAADAHSELTYSSPRMRWLWLAPLLFFFWANSHGAFVAGICIFSAYLIFRSIEVVLARGWQASGLLRRFGLMIAASVAATLINPYGPGLHLWLLESLGEPRPEICEWWPPEMFSLSSLPIWLIVSTFAASWIFSKKPRDFTHLALLGLTLWQMFSHQRHVPFFAILFGFWMAPHVESLLSRLGISNAAEEMEESMPRTMRLGFIACLLLAAVLLSVRLANRLSMVAVDRAEYPVSALQFMADEDLNGKLVVTFNWAQYAIASLGDDTNGEGSKVGFDGRFRTCYPQEVVDMHFDFVLGPGPPGTRFRSEASGPIDPSAVLHHKDPELVLISRLQKHSTYTMQQNTKEWVLLYQDSLAQVWGARWIYDNPNHPDYLPPSRRTITDELQVGEIAWPALPVAKQTTEFEIAVHKPRIK